MGIRLDIKSATNQNPPVNACETHFLFFEIYVNPNTEFKFSLFDGIKERLIFKL